MSLASHSARVATNRLGDDQCGGVRRIRGTLAARAAAAPAPAVKYGTRELSFRPRISFSSDTVKDKSVPTRRSRLSSGSRIVADASKQDGDGLEESSEFKKKKLKLPPSTRESRLSPDKFQTGPSKIWSVFTGLIRKSKKTLFLIGLLATWYSANIYFNIYNKQVLSVFPLATTCTFIHLLTASCLMSILWLLQVKKPPHLDSKVVREVAPLSSLHLLGFLFTNMSLGAVNVSLTHTIKSLEPFFTVVLSYIFLGSVPTIPVLLTLFPIVAGVVVASATDLSFNWYGFMTAMGSNLMFQSRNVISKKYMVESSRDSLEGGDDAEPLDEINLFACISIAAAVLMIPVVCALDGGALFGRWQAAGAGIQGFAGIMSLDSFFKTVIAGVCRTVDVLASYALLSRLNPVTHSVSNCIKRVVVIAVSIVFFKTPASFLNIVGTALALFGVFSYSMAKRMTRERPDLSKAISAPSPGVIEKILAVFFPGFLRTIFSGKAWKKVFSKKTTEDDDKVEYNL